MKRYFLCVLLMIFSTVFYQSTFAAPKPIEQIKGFDLISQKDFSRSFPGKAPVAVVFLSAKCPCSASHEQLLNDLSRQFPQVEFLGIHSNADETIVDSQKHFQEAQLSFPVIQDSKAHYANFWGALKTPHVFLLNKEGEIIYQGGVTDSHVGPSAKKQFLRDVLEDLTANKTLRHKQGKALGCYIQREDS